VQRKRSPESSARTSAGSVHQARSHDQLRDTGHIGDLELFDPEEEMRGFVGRLPQPAPADRSKRPDAYRQHLAQKNRKWLSRIRRKAETQLLKLGRQKNAWKVLRVGRFGAVSWAEDEARACLGGDIRDVWRQRKAGGAVDKKLEEAWLVAEIAAFAARAQSPEVQQELQELLTILRLLDLRRLALADPAARAQWLQQARQRGGRAPKRLPGINKRVLELVRANPQISVAEVWKSFPEPRAGDTETLIYRDGGKVVEVDNRTSRERSITYNTFRGYLKVAKNRLRD